MIATMRSEFRALGTGCVLLVTEPDALDDARRAVDTELAAIDLACSRFRDDSELAAVNAAQGRATPISAGLVEALEVSLRAAALTDGDLDPTIGSALRVLGYDRDFSQVGPGAPVLTLERIAGWRTVRIDRAAGTVTVPAGVSLDLGATAKAVAADRAARAAAVAAGCGVLVSLGGDIATAGPAPDGGWVVLVADSHDAPVDGPGQPITIRSGGLATSSTSVRRWARGDRQLHHIVDPATSQPAEVVWRTVTVAAATCVDANIASTTSIIRGERAPAWLGSMGLPARLVRPDGTTVVVGDWPRDDADGSR